MECLHGHQIRALLEARRNQGIATLMGDLDLQGFRLTDGQTAVELPLQYLELDSLSPFGCVCAHPVTFKLRSGVTSNEASQSIIDKKLNKAQ